MWHLTMGENSIWIISTVFETPSVSQHMMGILSFYGEQFLSMANLNSPSSMESRLPKLTRGRYINSTSRESRQINQNPEYFEKKTQKYTRLVLIRVVVAWTFPCDRLACTQPRSKSDRDSLRVTESTPLGIWETVPFHHRIKIGCHRIMEDSGY